jgi:trehalose utilization protein
MPTSMFASRALLALTFALLPAAAALAADRPPATATATTKPAPLLPAAKAPIRVLVWDEQQPAQKQAYGDKFLGETIAAALSKNPALVVRSVAMPEKGAVDRDPALSADSLDNTDVLIWWGHQRHREVRWIVAEKLVERVQAGKLSLIALHSAHWSSPFVAAMNARTIEDAVRSIPEGQRKSVRPSLIYPKLAVPKPDAPLTPSFTKAANADGTSTLTIMLPGCIFPAYRADGKPSHVTTKMPEHPIAKGVPANWDIPQTEMYSEPFHVPKPDAVIFQENWDAGETFRSGCVWNVGRGKVFYFRPGHETYPVYKQEIPLKIVENAALWLGEELRKSAPAK